MTADNVSKGPAAGDPQKFINWITRCDAIAGSASYIVNGYPEVQVGVLRLELKAAKGDGIDWRKIYSFIYENWHRHRPLFPDIETMTLMVERDE